MAQATDALDVVRRALPEVFERGDVERDALDRPELAPEHLLIALAELYTQAEGVLDTDAPMLREATQGAYDGRQDPDEPDVGTRMTSMAQATWAASDDPISPASLLRALLDDASISPLMARILNATWVDRAEARKRLDPDLKAAATGHLWDIETEAAPLPPRAATKTAPSSSTATLDKAEPQHAPPEGVRTHTDRPADDDQLQRKPLAEVLADRIRRVRGEDTDNPEGRRFGRRKRGAGGQEGALLVHLHAPWGAGKSSFLNFLRRELHEPDDPDLVQWIVVDFSAWRHQRIPPPWWWLLAAIRSEGLRSLWSINPGRAAWFWIRDFLWRFWNARVGWVPLLCVGGVALAAAETDLFGLADENLTGLNVTAGAIAAILGLLVTGWGLVQGVSRWLLIGRTPVTSRVLERTHDPLAMIRRRFRWLVKQLHQPIAVFIDDLDRCQGDYVVELLEGVQTLLVDEPVVYVVAADRSWLCDSYLNGYKDYERSVDQPGRPLGYLFLEKTFQISFELPPMTGWIRKDYWERLVGTADENGRPEDMVRQEPLPSERSEVSSNRFTAIATWPLRRLRRRRERRWRAIEVRKKLEQLQGLKTEEAVIQLAEHSSPKDADEFRRLAVRRLGASDLEEQLQHMLLPFAPLVDRNPRAMKRLVNAYGLERTRLVREGTPLDPETRQRLVLWTIAKMRWPALTERLSEKPALTDWIHGEGPKPTDEKLGSLLSDPAVCEVFSGAGLEGVELTTDDVKEFVQGPTDDPRSIDAKPLAGA